MIKRTLILASVLVAFGVLVAMRPSKAVHVDEAWLEATYPETVGDYHMRPGPGGGHQSYRMDSTTYDKLKAYGIVCRVLENVNHRFDVVVIGGDQPDTFHDPVACFKAQEWTIQGSKHVVLQTKNRPPVHANLTHAAKGGEDHMALYTYEGPSDTFPENGNLHQDLFWTQLRTSEAQTATFFRFVSLDPGTSEEDLIRFGTEYLDASPVRPMQKLARS